MLRLSNIVAAVTALVVAVFVVVAVVVTVVVVVEWRGCGSGSHYD